MHARPAPNWSTLVETGRSLDERRSFRDDGAAAETRFDTEIRSFVWQNDLTIGADQIITVGVDLRDDRLDSTADFTETSRRDDAGFAQSLARVADCFVMDAFAVAHRAHASTVGLPPLLPSAMGMLVEREVTALGRTLDIDDDAKPLAALMGGAKVSDKILILENLLDKLDHLFIGGGMSVTFLNAQGNSTGASSVETDRLDFARQIMERAAQAVPHRRGVGAKFHLDTFRGPVRQGGIARPS